MTHFRICGVQNYFEQTVYVSCQHENVFNHSYFCRTCQSVTYTYWYIIWNNYEAQHKIFWISFPHCKKLSRVLCLGGRYLFIVWLVNTNLCISLLYNYLLRSGWTRKIITNACSVCMRVLYVCEIIITTKSCIIHQTRWSLYPVMNSSVSISIHAHTSKLNGYHCLK